MQPKVTLHTKGYCPHCRAAKKLLTSKGIGFANHDLEIRPKLRAEMIAKAGSRTTVPQILIGDFHVGGNSDLVALNATGHLDALLGIKQPA